MIKIKKTPKAEFQPTWINTIKLDDNTVMQRNLVASIRELKDLMKLQKSLYSNEEVRFERILKD